MRRACSTSLPRTPSAPGSSPSLTPARIATIVALENLWGEWERKADVTGQMTFYGMQSLAVRSMVESGETVLRFVDRPLDSGLRVPFQLQALESDYIDQYRDGIYGDPANTGRRPRKKPSRCGPR